MVYPSWNKVTEHKRNKRNPPRWEINTLPLPPKKETGKQSAGYVLIPLLSQAQSVIYSSLSDWAQSCLKMTDMFWNDGFLGSAFQLGV